MIIYTTDVFFQFIACHFAFPKISYDYHTFLKFIVYWFFFLVINVFVSYLRNYFLPRYQKILSEIVFLKFHVSLFSHFSCTGNYYVLLSGMDFRVCFSLYITGLISICYKTVFSFLTCGTHFIINCFHIWWVCFWALFCSVNIVYAYVVTTQS